jgi:predicted negative regulator of RcsB-dependent stress response
MIEAATAFESFMEAHLKKVIYLVLAGVVATGAFAIIRHNQRTAAELAGAEATAAKTIDDCNVVLQKHKGTAAAGTALLTKAKLEWEQTKKDDAVKSLRSFVQDYTDHPFHVQGILALASRLESMGDKDAAEAQTLFEKITKEHKDHPAAALAQMRIGESLLASGKSDEAKAVFEELQRKFPSKEFFDETAKRLDWIAAGLPTKEVDAPKTPDALKAPGAAAPGGAPPFDITPGGPATSKPFEVKMDTPNATPGAAPTVNIQPIAPKVTITPQSGAPGGATPTIKMETSTPKVEIKPQPAPAAVTPPPAATTSPDAKK